MRIAFQSPKTTRFGAPFGRCNLRSDGVHSQIFVVSASLALKVPPVDSPWPAVSKTGLELFVRGVVVEVWTMYWFDIGNEGEGERRSGRMIDRSGYW